jgi:2,3-bisphosphoglycerate-independent phosphoglycerate mutase
MKGILVIADGLGGRPTDMDGKTCLEAANTPTLDALAARGALGLVDPIGPGIRPGSDTAHLSLLGYDPYAVYTGRGVFECLGIGMDVRPGDICFRANFATVEESADGLRLVDRRAGRIERGQRDLEEALRALRLTDVDGVTVEFRASTQHRGALRLRGEGLSRYISETDPHEVGALIHRSVATKSADAAAERTAAAVNELTRKSYDLLRDLPLNRERVAAGKPPANIILVRGAADCPDLPSVESMYGVRSAVIAGGALYRGVALGAGMTVLEVPGATGGLDTDLGAKADALVAALEAYDVVFVHIKGTDNAGHDSDAEGKAAFIERIDREFFSRIVERIDWRSTHLAFTGDHTTPIDFGDHTCEPVPVLFVGPNVCQDATTAFGEREAGRGGLGRFSGRVLPMVLGYCNWSPKFGS